VVIGCDVWKLRRVRSRETSGGEQTDIFIRSTTLTKQRPSMLTNETLDIRDS
jgi:hypothetical protein